MIAHKYIEEVKQLLDKFASRAKEEKINTDSGWTHEIKELIGGLGNKYQFNVCASGSEKFEPEWLYDLVWYEEFGEGENARLVQVPLVMECEWSLLFDQIKNDFEKLLLANSILRIMICYVYLDNQKKTIEYFRDAISKYQLSKPGDTFLIAILDYDTNEFIYEVMTK
jgi:hypothetical protein